MAWNRPAWRRGGLEKAEERDDDETTIPTEPENNSAERNNNPEAVKFSLVGDDSSLMDS